MLLARSSILTLADSLSRYLLFVLVGIAGVKVKLTPFQIVYISESDRDVEVTLEPMMLLSETRDHLEKTDFSKHLAFESLQLYQTIRSEGDRMFSNGTHVAFGGQATFSEKPMTDEEMLEVQYLSFLGRNETAYVDRLKLMGWKGLKRALLMTATGGMINYDNGAMKMMPTEDDSRDMEPGMSNLIVSIATLVPIAILSLAIFLFTGFVLRTKIRWKLSASDTDSIWMLGRQRKPTASETNNDNSTASSASVRVAIDSGVQHGPKIHPTLLRIQEKAVRAADKV